MDSLSFLTLGAAAGNAGGYSSIILIVLMVALMYFFMIRPQQKQRKQHQEMMNELHKGDEVVTIGRLHGKVDAVNKDDRTVTLDCEGIYLTFDMVAIARVVKRAGAEVKPADQQPAEKPAKPVAKGQNNDSAAPAEDPADDDKNDKTK